MCGKCPKYPGTGWQGTGLQWAMISRIFTSSILALGLAAGLIMTCASNPPANSSGPDNQAVTSAETQASPAPLAARLPGLDAWEAAARMGLGINIGNTLENTTTWETGWGNPRITREYVQALAALGFKTVRLPVAWDTYAKDGVIQADKFQRVGEVVDWILDAGMFCVMNIHWDGGWIDSSWAEKFPSDFATFSPVAEKKYPAYWQQIASYFADRDERLIFEALNEETNFKNMGSDEDAYATLTRVNQLFVDTVRATGGKNSHRLLVVAGYGTDISRTCSYYYQLPQDTVPNRLFISVHYYTPSTFCILTEDASWGKVKLTWGGNPDLNEMDRLMDAMEKFSRDNDIPVFIGEFGVPKEKESESRVRWLSSVARTCLDRKMVPVLWDTGGDVARKAPFAASADLQAVRQLIADQSPLPPILNPLP